MDREERQLLAALQRGEESAFDTLVRRFQHRVYGMCLRLLGDRQEAEDIAQEVFLSVFRHIGGFRGESSLSTWLWRVTRNHCLNRLKHLKRRRHRQHLSLESPGERESQTRTRDLPAGEECRPDSRLQEKQLRQLLEAEIARLTPEHREIVVFADLEHLGYEEIQQITGLPLGTIKSRLHRARLELAARLAPYLEESGERKNGT
jgi:RNA polymerase sigma-70 factor (ECF subfamily)